MIYSPHQPINQKNRGMILSEIKADLFSLLQTASFIKNRFDIGLIDKEFYFKQFQFFANEILIIQNTLLQYRSSLEETLKDLPLNSDSKTLIGVISCSRDYYFNQLASSWQLDPICLAASATMITSQFITILDYLHLVDELDFEFLKEMIDKLKDFLMDYSTFGIFLSKITNVENNLFSDEKIVPKEDIEEQIFQIFNEFKAFLHIKSP